ncbi:MAG: DUF4197 domain-containing protein [Desulfovibrionaceae bacterium]
MRITTRFAALALGLALLAPLPAGAIDLGNLKSLGKELIQSKTATTTGTSSAVSGLTDSEVVDGLKQALEKAADTASSTLGASGGFLDNLKVRIPVPDSLAPAETVLRKLGQDELADDFIASMNHAAEQAAGQTAPIFVKAIKAMSIEDAKGVLTGGDDAATQYLERTTSDDLTTLIKPIVTTAMQSTGVTRTYSAFAKKAATAAPLVGSDFTDLESYVTEKALDGLFVVMAEQEKEIRDNPVQWTTSVLKKVFGAAAE